MQFEVYKASGVTVADTDYEGTAVSYDEFEEVVEENNRLREKLAKLEAEKADEEKPKCGLCGAPREELRYSHCRKCRGVEDGEAKTED